MGAASPGLIDLIYAATGSVGTVAERTDAVISEYGASLWCDPYQWILEAARLLVPGGHLVFMRYSPLFALCVRPEGSVSTTLSRAQFGLTRLDWGDHVQFILPHGEMFRLLRSSGFIVEDLVEVQAPRSAHLDYTEVPAEWAQQWRSEEIWKARLAG
ncbi:hypothetical protein [Streptomyces sp. NPDC018693]|uniref:hypothetical protein n=1 Tax=unclassified Streptomyces TaxID=2593676 RepID=UPI0037BCB41B